MTRLHFEVDVSGSQASCALPGRYELDGALMDERWDAGILSWRDVVTIGTLAPGESVTLGGGAGATCDVRRVEALNHRGEP